MAAGYYSPSEIAAAIKVSGALGKDAIEELSEAFIDCAMALDSMDAKKYGKRIRMLADVGYAIEELT